VKGHANSRRGRFAATPVRACSPRVYPGDGGGCAQVRRSAGLAFQGRKRSRSGPARGFPPFAAAFAEVGGEPGQEVQAGHLGGGGDGPDHGGVRAVSPLREPPAFFLVTTGPRIILSAALLSLSGRPDNTNYPDGAVMPVSVVRTTICSAEGCWGRPNEVPWRGSTGGLNRLNDEPVTV